MPGTNQTPPPPPGGWSTTLKPPERSGDPGLEPALKKPGATAKGNGAQKTMTSRRPAVTPASTARSEAAARSERRPENSPHRNPARVKGVSRPWPVTTNDRLIRSPREDWAQRRQGTQAATATPDSPQTGPSHTPPVQACSRVASGMVTSLSQLPPSNSTAAIEPLMRCTKPL